MYRNYTNYYTDVNEGVIDNKLASIQNKIDELTKNINTLNNSQNLDTYIQKYNETMGILNKELRTLRSFSNFNKIIISNSNFTNKYGIDFEDITLSKLDEIINSEKNKVMKSNTFKDNKIEHLSRKNMIQLFGLIIIFTLFSLYFYV
jgi:hypothetical protein